MRTPPLALWGGRVGAFMEGGGRVGAFREGTRGDWVVEDGVGGGGEVGGRERGGGRGPSVIGWADITVMSGLTLQTTCHSQRHSDIVYVSIPFVVLCSGGGLGAGEGSSSGACPWTS